MLILMLISFSGVLLIPHPPILQLDPHRGGGTLIEDTKSWKLRSQMNLSGNFQAFLILTIFTSFKPTMSLSTSLDILINLPGELSTIFPWLTSAARQVDILICYCVFFHCVLTKIMTMLSSVQADCHICKFTPTKMSMVKHLGWLLHLHICIFVFVCIFANLYLSAYLHIN